MLDAERARAIGKLGAWHHVLLRVAYVVLTVAAIAVILAFVFR